MHVFDIWNKFFGFSEEVAQCLTKLTTKEGQLPQGSITSSTLANLVFWHDEVILFNKLASQRLTYSRYVDDIAVSSKRFLTDKDKSDVIKQVYGMLLDYGYKPKRSKHEIVSSASRMEVTKLAINDKPGIRKETRSKIRAAVYNLEKRIASGEEVSFDSGDYSRVMGSVRHLQRFHPNEGNKLRKRMIDLKDVS